MKVVDSKPFHRVLTLDNNESIDSSEVIEKLKDQFGYSEEEAEKSAGEMFDVLEEMAWAKNHRPMLEATI